MDSEGNRPPCWQANNDERVWLCLQAPVDGFTNKTKGEMVTFEQSVVVVTMLKIQISSLAASANHSRTDFSSQNH